MKIKNFLILLLIFTMDIPSDAMAREPVHLTGERWYPAPPPASLNAFLTKPMHRWLLNLRTALVDERSKSPARINNVSLTIELDETQKSQKVQILKSCGKIEDDQLALNLLHKVLRPAPDNSLDGTDIIIRFNTGPVTSIELWNQGSWVCLASSDFAANDSLNCPLGYA